VAHGLVKGEGFAVDASVLEANASRYHGKPPHGPRQKRAVAEYLAALEAEAQSRDEVDRDNGDSSSGGGQASSERKPPKVVSPSDPSSARMAKASKRVHFGYGLNYLIDVEHAVIVDVEATPARTYDEVAATRIMLECSRRRFKLSPKRLAADRAYGTGKFVTFVTGAGIIPHIPVWDKTRRDDGTFSRSEFKFDRRRNVYTSPAGETLRTNGRVHSHANASVPRCRECPLKPQCCPNMAARRIVRDFLNTLRPTHRWRDCRGGRGRKIGRGPGSQGAGSVSDRMTAAISSQSDPEAFALLDPIQTSPATHLRTRLNRGPRNSRHS
jgi:hypothetical protein